MSANDGVWQPPTLIEQKEAFETVLKNVVELTAAQRKRLAQHLIRVVSDLAHVEEDTLLEIFPTKGQGALKAMTKTKLRALRLWAIGKENELFNLGIPLSAEEFTHDTCEIVQRKMVAVSESYKKFLVFGSFDKHPESSEQWQLTKDKPSPSLEQEPFSSDMWLQTTAEHDSEENIQENETSDGSAVTEVEHHDHKCFSSSEREHNLEHNEQENKIADGCAVTHVEYHQELHCHVRDEGKIMHDSQPTHDFKMENGIYPVFPDKVVSNPIVATEDDQSLSVCDSEYENHNSDNQKLKNREFCDHATNEKVTFSPKFKQSLSPKTSNDAKRSMELSSIKPNSVRSCSDQFRDQMKLAENCVKNDSNTESKSEKRDGTLQLFINNKKHARSLSDDNQGKSKKIKSSETEISNHNYPSVPKASSDKTNVHTKSFSIKNNNHVKSCSNQIKDHHEQKAAKSEHYETNVKSGCKQGNRSPNQITGNKKHDRSHSDVNQGITKKIKSEKLQNKNIPMEMTDHNSYGTDKFKQNKKSSVPKVSSYLKKITQQNNKY